MMLGAFFINSSKRHLPNSMQADRHYSDSWLHLFTVISTMMRKGYVIIYMLWDELSYNAILTDLLNMIKMMHNDEL